MTIGLINIYDIVMDINYVVHFAKEGRIRLGQSIFKRFLIELQEKYCYRNGAQLLDKYEHRSLPSIPL